MSDDNTEPMNSREKFHKAFKAHSKFGDAKSDGEYITLSQSDKWMKKAKVIDGQNITTADTAIHFNKLKQKKLHVDDYHKYLKDLASTKKIKLSEIMSKLTKSGQPGVNTKVKADPATSSTVDRLTDTSKYTGSHKQRFDKSGKGRGIAGRKNVADQSGYVSGYKNKGTYDKN